MAEVIPACIPQNLDFVKERFSKVLGLVKKVQIDIADGVYTRAKTWPFVHGDARELLKTLKDGEKLPYAEDFVLEIDMLVTQPEHYIEDLIQAGARSFVIHVDSTQKIDECIDLIKKSGLDVGLGVKPSGDISMVEKYLSKINFVQFMGNDHVGFNGVLLDPKVYENIKRFRDTHPGVPIQVDIGVNFETGPMLCDAGATGLVSGSTIFNTTDQKEAINKLKCV